VRIVAGGRDDARCGLCFARSWLGVGHNPSEPVLDHGWIPDDRRECVRDGLESAVPKHQADEPLVDGDALVQVSHGSALFLEQAGGLDSGGCVHGKALQDLKLVFREGGFAAAGRVQNTHEAAACKHRHAHRRNDAFGHKDLGGGRRPRSDVLEPVVDKQGFQL